MSAAATETVTVLITDQEGSTAMAQRLGPVAAEELRLEYFRMLRGAVERARGREVKNLGDGLMVVFDSAAQSLACAVQMQQALDLRNRRAEEKLGVRIGVSLGDTSVEGGDYFGGPVVEAARLCARAEGGEIIVTDLVYRLGGSRDGYVFESLGGLELKGISEPVQAFKLRWAPAPAFRIALPEQLQELPATAYVGRAAERERMRELWGQACGGSLRVALLSGEPGMGKTRLATHLALAAHGKGSTVLYGRCDEDLGVPYLPWVQALGHLVREVPQPVLDEHVEHFGGDLARLVPSLRDRVPDLPSVRESDPETERYRLHAAVAGLLEGAGEQEPLLLILDDLHWADAPTLALLRHIVTCGSSMKVMVVGSYRDADLSREHPLTALLAALRRERGVERVKLSGLDAGHVAALMEAAAGHELGEDGRALAAEITRETSGNPLFAFRVLRHLTESGAIVQENGRWRLTGSLADLGLPAGMLLQHADAFELPTFGLLDEKPPVRVAASPTIADFVLPTQLAIMERATGYHPTIELSAVNSATAIAMVAAGTVDMAIAAFDSDQTPDGLVEIPLCRDEVVLAVPVEHHWAALEEVPLKAFLSTSLIMRDPGANTRRIVEQVLHEKGLMLAPALLEVGCTAEVQEAARRRRAPALLSELAVASAEGLVARRVTGMSFERRFSLLLTSESSLRAGARALVDHLRSQLVA